MSESGAEMPLTDEQSRLVSSNLHLVDQGVRIFGRQLSYDLRRDVQGEATLGLIDAAKRYIPREGVTFEAYAWHRVRGAIKDFMRREYLRNIGRTVGAQIRRVDAARMQIEYKTGGEAPLAEVAEATGLSLERLGQLYAAEMMLPKKHFSLELLGKDNPGTADRSVVSVLDPACCPYVSMKIMDFVAHGCTGTGIVSDAIAKGARDGVSNAELASHLGFSVPQIAVLCDWVFDEAIQAADFRNFGRPELEFAGVAERFKCELRRVLEQKPLYHGAFLQQRMGLWEARRPFTAERPAASLADLAITSGCSVSNLSQVITGMHLWISRDRHSRKAFMDLYGYPPELFQEKLGRQNQPRKRA